MIGPMSRRSDPEYDRLLDEGRACYPGLRIGRPGRSRGYWLGMTLIRILRVRYRVQQVGADRVRPGAGIIVSNHVSLMDPVVTMLGNRWRIGAFTKVEAFESLGGIFFRMVGQIPLRRGDEAATKWALAMASWMLADGSMIGLYPEGTRSPDPRHLHRLHKRVLVPVLQANPDIPVYAVTVAYETRRWRRTRVEVRFSAPLELDARAMDADALTSTVRDALLALGGQEYVDRYARDVKAARSTR